jgi:phosphoadenosine phosphosulfate reductase
MIGDLHRLRRVIDPQKPAESLRAVREAVVGRIVFTTSFGLEDQVVTHLIASQGLDIQIVTLDTGRLFPETYDAWAATESRYGLKVAAYSPETSALEELVQDQGINGFRASIDARKACCHVRKVAPLGRALAGASVWVTGLRADQSATRSAVEAIGLDPVYDLLKFNPLVSWSRDDAVAFVRTHDVPLNALHDKGFPSIGCAPCTRAIDPGEQERAGRWWWEQAGESDTAQKECGLHVNPNGDVVRSKPSQVPSVEAQP